MKWPWVSREMLESVTAVANKCLDDERRLYDDLSVRYGELLKMYHALKLQGAVSTESHKPVEAKEPDAVQYAIADKAQRNHALKLYLTGWAAKQRQLQVADSEIVERLTNWQSASDDE